MRSKACKARQGKLKCYYDSEVTAMAENMSIKASLPSLHDKTYLSPPRLYATCTDSF